MSDTGMNVNGGLLKRRMPVRDLPLEDFAKMLGGGPDWPDSRDLVFGVSRHGMTISAAVGGLRRMLDVPIAIEPELPRKFQTQGIPVPGDQGQTPWCAAYTGAYIASYLNAQEKAFKGKFTDFAESWLYHQARIAAGMQDPKVSGVYLRSVLQVMRKQGVMPQYAWSDFHNRPKKKYENKALEQAANFQLQSFASVRLNHAAIKTAIMNFGLVAVSTRVYEGWQKVGRDGRVPLPFGNNDPLGGHGVVLYGWDDDLSHHTGDDGYYFGVNWWGIDWGHNGHFYLPYGYVDRRIVYNCYSCIDKLGSKEMFEPNAWQSWLASWPPELKKIFGIAF